jgi:predicted DNA-binding transcriptional regulator YafY
MVMVARVSGGYRTYRIAKVLDLEMLDEGFERPAGFDLSAHWRQDLRRFEASLRRGEAVLRVSGAALSRLDRLGADIAEAIMAVPPDAKGWRQATVPIESIEQAAAMLLSFGAEIEVVSPPALRRQLAESARQVLALYAEGTQTGKRKRRPSPRS